MPFVIKIFGFIFIVGATTLFGVTLTQALKQRLNALNWFLGATEEIAEKIRYSSAELPHIVRSVYGYDTYLSVDEPFRVTIKNAGLNKDDIKVLEEFFSTLGMGDGESQVKRCEVYKRQLLRRCEQADKEFSEKSRLYTRLGFLGGIGIVIMLI